MIKEHNELIIPFTTKSCGDVTTPLKLDWVLDYCNNGIIVSSKDYRKLTKMEMYYQEAPIMYKRFNSLLELMEEVRSKYSKFVISKFDFVNTNSDLKAEDWSNLISTFTNNYRNNILLYRWMITFFYCFELSTDGYWHCHFVMIFANKWNTGNLTKDYREYVDDMYLVGLWFRGLIMNTVGYIDCINFTKRIPLDGPKVIVYSKSDNIFSINCDIVWLSYLCKQNSLTKAYLKVNDKARLFGKGKVR